MFTISDHNVTETAETMPDLLDLIAEWYEDSAEWATGTATAAEHQAVRDAIASVERPDDDCTLEQAQEYASDVCTAIARAGGFEDWQGHGTYFVAAADRAGLSLSTSRQTYHVFHAPDGCAMSYCGARDTLEAAQALAEREPHGLEESLWATAEAAGHCGGLCSPSQEAREAEPVSWHGRHGDYCICVTED